jgi:hypothetical protein
MGIIMDFVMIDKDVLSGYLEKGDATEWGK